MGFYDWFKDDSDKELGEAVSNNMDRGLNDRKLKLIPFYGVYLQKLANDKTKSLVWGTWVLAGATIILAIATIILVIVTKLSFSG